MPSIAKHPSDMHPSYRTLSCPYDQHCNSTYSVARRHAKGLPLNKHAVLTY